MKLQLPLKTKGITKMMFLHKWSCLGTQRAAVPDQGHICRGGDGQQPQSWHGCHRRWSACPVWRHCQPQQSRGWVMVPEQGETTLSVISVIPSADVLLSYIYNWKTWTWVTSLPSVYLTVPDFTLKASCTRMSLQEHSACGDCLCDVHVKLIQICV